jgi:hypothetical protein
MGYIDYRNTLGSFYKIKIFFAKRNVYDMWFSLMEKNPLYEWI